MKLIRVFILLILVINVLCYSQFSGGSGTVSDPWQISNVNELQLMKDHLSSHFILINDIYASATSSWNDGLGFIPVGSGGYYEPTLNFQGSLNGNNYTISYLHVQNSVSDYSGLFGSIGTEAVVENINIVNSYIEGNDFSGGLVGENSGIINNCNFSGEIRGTGIWYSGGLVGQNYYGFISNSYSSVIVYGCIHVGGLVGNNSYGVVSNSFSSGLVFGSVTIGGLVGFVLEGEIESSYFSGYIYGGSPIGGLIGSISDGSISNSFYNVDSVQINEMNYLSIGGIYNDQYIDWYNNGLNLNIENYSSTLIPNGEYYEISSIEGLRDLLGFSGVEGYKFILKNPLDLSSANNLFIPYLASEFDGDDHIISNLNIDITDGSNLGLFGYLSNQGFIKNCNLNNSNIIGSATIGGLVGNNDGTIQNSNIQGSINGESTIGGLVGANSGNITNSNAETIISGIFVVGGLVGANSSDGTINNSFASGTVSGDYMLTGGFAGYNFGAISCSYSTCDVLGNSFVGGFVGENYFGNINNSYSRGNIKRIASSTSTDIGGFAGSNNRARILNCYSTGNVLYGDSEPPTDKGFCGYIERDDENYEMLGNYWDIETSNQDSTAGEAIGKLTSEMTYPYGDSTYVGWDFSTIWRDDITDQNDGYPTFVWVSGIENNEYLHVVKGYELFQNYPNPFNNQTVLPYELKSVSDVKINILNVKGEMVKAVTLGKQPKGVHEYKLNAEGLTTGVYYYSLKINGKVTGNKKMLYLR